jgi:hypothetical protein
MFRAEHIVIPKASIQMCADAQRMGNKGVCASAAKAGLGTALVIAAMNRCAAQNPELSFSGSLAGLCGWLHLGG